jgi:diacylglycerol kinase (ATP)
MTRYVVLVNPRAGTRPAEVAEVGDALDAAGVAHDIEVVTGGRETMRDAVVDVIASGRRLTVVGGDGTVGLAVEALVDAGLAADAPPLGVLPAGTGCDLLRTFGIPQDLRSAARHLATPSEYRIDAGRVEGEWGDRVFVNVGQAGVGAAAAHTARRVPRRLGSARYPAAFAARLPRFPPAEVTIGGDRPHRGRALAVIVANGQFFAGGWNVAPKAMIGDGALDVQVIDVHKRETPILVPRVIKGLHLGHPGVKRWSAARVTVATDVPWPVEADGDFLGRTPCVFGALPGAISLKI